MLQENDALPRATKPPCQHLIGRKNDTTSLFGYNVLTLYFSSQVRKQFKFQIWGSRVGVVVRALAFHQCVPGSIPGPGVICGLSLLVLYSAPRGFSPGTPVFPSPQKPTFDLI